MDIEFVVLDLEKMSFCLNSERIKLNIDNRADQGGRYL